MSLTLVLMPTVLPMVAAIGSTVSAAAIAAACSMKERTIAPVQTSCLDKGLLTKTLTEQGLAVEEVDENTLRVVTEGGEVLYHRAGVDRPYFAEARNVKHPEETMAALQEFETAYGRNVQAFTYGKIKEALAEHGLTLQGEEVLEDDSILLTLAV